MRRGQQVPEPHWIQQLVEGYSLSSEVRTGCSSSPPFTFRGKPPSGPPPDSWQTGIIRIRGKLTCLGTSPSGSGALAGTATPGSLFRTARNLSNRSFSKRGNLSAASTASSKESPRKSSRSLPSPIPDHPKQTSHLLPFPSPPSSQRNHSAPESASPCAYLSSFTVLLAKPVPSMRTPRPSSSIPAAPSSP